MQASVQADTARQQSHGILSAPGDAFADENEIGGLSLPAISPLHCIVTGLNDVGRVKADLEFRIEARSAAGEAVGLGGGAFFIAIRGAARVRARIADRGDGTYTVQWRPPLSGEYSIAVSHFGVSISGSPFRVKVHAAEPYAPNCEVRGSLDPVPVHRSRAVHVHAHLYDR